MIIVGMTDASLGRFARMTQETDGFRAEYPPDTFAVVRMIDELRGRYGQLPYLAGAVLLDYADPSGVFTALLVLDKVLGKDIPDAVKFPAGSFAGSESGNGKATHTYTPPLIPFPLGKRRVESVPFRSFSPLRSLYILYPMGCSKVSIPWGRLWSNLFSRRQCTLLTLKRCRSPSRHPSAVCALPNASCVGQDRLAVSTGCPQPG